jgi:hypothetical protein
VSDDRIVAALLDFLRDNEPIVLSPGGHYMRSGDGRPIVLDVIAAQAALARLRGDK